MYWHGLHSGLRSLILRYVNPTPLTHTPSPPLESPAAAWDHPGVWQTLYALTASRQNGQRVSLPPCVQMLSTNALRTAIGVMCMW